jgi:tripartite-type tricarboxylate transporter receptor subunit TctC
MLPATLLLFALVATGPASAWAQGPFPSKPIELTVLFGAGSGADLLARKLAEAAAKGLAQPVAVVNRTGAGGALGYEAREYVEAGVSRATAGLSCG